jgi:hypothetical protein
LDKKNKPENENNNPPGIKLRCINIDCVFNSANKPNAKRNFCSHPNLKVESNMADITIAICSEFRSKKDYRLEDKFTLVDLKTNEQIQVKGTPEPTLTEIEKVTQEDLEQSISEQKEEEPKEVSAEETKETGQPKPAETVYETPAIISTGESQQDAAEVYNLTSSKTSNFVILKKLYQPYLRRGIIFSIFFHLFVIFILYITLVPKGEKNEVQPQQRIVVVEDIQTPKFDPPDIDKQKEEESKEIGENTQVVRPKITPKKIKPKITRPVDEEKDTTGLTSHLNEVTDSLKHLTDSLLALNQDTTKLQIPDSLKNFMPQNAIGMKLWYPKNWKLTDNRSLNLNLEQFKGVIINTDSLSEDPGAVSIFVQIDDPKHSAYNKTVFKNTFQMDDSLIIAFSTDPVLTGSQRISYKFFLFTDPTGQSNVFVNSETKQDMFEKYRKYIEAIVRSIQIVKNPTTPSDNKTTNGTSDGTVDK